MGIIQINGICYDVPQEFDLLHSLDEHSGTYRISLGLVDPTDEQRAKYDPLFAMLKSQSSGLFVDTTITIEQGNQRLKMALATLDIYVHPFGTFCELESAIDDTTLSIIKETKKNVSNRRTSVTKDKKIDGKRKTTDKGNNRIGRT